MKRRDYLLQFTQHGEEFVHHSRIVDPEDFGEFDTLVHVREVLPDDPDPEWVDELIRLCDEADTTRTAWGGLEVREHLAKRGEK